LCVRKEFVMTESGWQHLSAREEAKARVEWGDVDCWRCGGWIPPGSDWQLGHDDYDPRFIRGPEHKSCSLKADAAKGARVADARRLGITALDM
jgi:hypothetical protein